MMLRASQSVAALLLVNISEVHVLSISHVAKGCRVKVSTLKASFLHALDPVTPGIFSRQHHSQYNHNDELDEMADNHRPDSKLVSRTLVGLVEEWSGYGMSVNRLRRKVGLDLPILPVQYPRKSTPFVKTFFVCPAVFAVVIDKIMQKAALYGPVK